MVNYTYNFEHGELFLTTHPPLKIRRNTPLKRGESIEVLFLDFQMGGGFEKIYYRCQVEAIEFKDRVVTRGFWPLKRKEVIYEPTAKCYVLGRTPIGEENSALVSLFR